MGEGVGQEEVESGQHEEVKKDEEGPGDRDVGGIELNEAESIKAQEEALEHVINVGEASRV